MIRGFGQDSVWFLGLFLGIELWVMEESIYFFYIEVSDFRDYQIDVDEGDEILVSEEDESVLVVYLREDIWYCGVYVVVEELVEIL